MRLLALVGCTLAAAGVPVTRGGSATPAFLGPFGQGADRVWLLVPKSRPRAVVVFLHGWKLDPPSPASPWVGQFRPWLDHLVERGNAVVFPAYQTGGDVQGPDRIASLRRGLETGLRRVAHPGLPVVVAGYSYGGSLAFYYAADARKWGLPRPAAVDAVFPAGMIPGAALVGLPARVRVLIEVGDHDTVAGRAGADEFLAWLERRPGRKQRLAVVRSRPGLEAVHAAPKLATPLARRAFWAPLDALISSVR